MALTSSDVILVSHQPALNFISRGVAEVFLADLTGNRGILFPLVHDYSAGNCIQWPAWLLGIGISVFVEMCEIPFFIKERSPACRGIRWKNRRYVIWLWIEILVIGFLIGMQWSLIVLGNKWMNLPSIHAGFAKGRLNRLLIDAGHLHRCDGILDGELCESLFDSSCHRGQ